MITIRRARADDAPALATIAEQTFRDTFSANTPAADMDLHCRSTYSAAIQAREISDPAIVTWLAEDDTVLVGYAQWRPSQPHRCVLAERPSELNRIYCLRDWKGKGVAARLMAEVFGSAVDASCDSVWLGVWERNDRAIAFYRKFGFIEVGDHVFPVGSDLQRDLIMSAAVSQEAGPR